MICSQAVTERFRPVCGENCCVMQRNGQRLYRLIRQLLDLSKLEVGRMPLQARERDLVAFIRHILLSFSPAARQAGYYADVPS